VLKALEGGVPEVPSEAEIEAGLQRVGPELKNMKRNVLRALLERQYLKLKDGARLEDGCIVSLTQSGQSVRMNLPPATATGTLG
jgi:hypothetical protein